MTLTTSSSQLSNRFEQALVYATQLHANQVRKGSGVPYISHLLSVAALVLEDGGDEDEAIAALLHDSIEDCGGAEVRQAILIRFGERVTTIVEGCTESNTQPKPPWRERKLKYLEQMSQTSPAILRVSMADKLHNARSILADFYQQGDAVWQKFKNGKAGTLWFYGQLIEIYERTAHSFLLEDLKRIINLLG